MILARIVVQQEVLEEYDVHPPVEFEQWIQLSRHSATDFFEKEGKGFDDVGCPACGSRQRVKSFSLESYQFLLCNDCATRYLSPRPTGELLQSYLRKSKAAISRNEGEYRHSLEQRLAGQAEVRAEWVANTLALYGISPENKLVEIESRSPHFCQYWQNMHNGTVTAVNPFFPEKDVSFALAGQLSEIADQSVTAIAAFDILEHQSSPINMLTEIWRVLAPGGLLLLSTRSGSGLDVLMLGEKATLFPLEHMNLITVEGMKLLLGKVGFTPLELSTPGQLDVAIIDRCLRQDPAATSSEFMRYFMRFRGKEQKDRLQTFLQENLLSSHLRLVTRKEVKAAP